MPHRVIGPRKARARMRLWRALAGPWQRRAQAVDSEPVAPCLVLLPTVDKAHGRSSGPETGLTRDLQRRSVGMLAKPAPSEHASIDRGGAAGP